MIKETELRIGNYLEKYLEPTISEWIETKINSLDITLISRKEKHGFRPIPLTEKWLESFGFEARKGEKDYLEIESPIDSFYLRPSFLGGFYWGFNYNNEIDNQNNLKHVHQLQNLYFALTGEELTLKD